MKKALLVLSIMLSAAITSSPAWSSAKTKCYGACNSEYRSCDKEARMKEYPGDKDARNKARKSEMKQCEVVKEACKKACNNPLF